MCFGCSKDRNDIIMIFSVLGFRSDIRIELQAPVLYNLEARPWISARVFFSECGLYHVYEQIYQLMSV